MTLLLTKPFTEEIVPRDDADRWALMHERALRELRWRRGVAPDVSFKTDTLEVRLIEEIPARDAGDVCHVCAQIVTWTDHLPPLEAGGPVRCFANVEYLPPRLGPGERRTGDAIVYSAAFLDPEVV